MLDAYFTELVRLESAARFMLGVNGYLDVIPVAKVRAFEDGLRPASNHHADILEDIRVTKDLSNETAAA